MTAFLLAVLSAAGFMAASFLGLLGRKLSLSGRSYPAAIAAGILLALAFADLFPEGLELSGDEAIVGFIGGFALLFIIELFTQPHHLHEDDVSDIPKQMLGPFVVGLLIHNLSDGFVLGVGARTVEVTSALVGLGVVIHQFPVGISVAAILVAGGASRARTVWTTCVLGLAIPFAAVLTVLLPVPGGGTLGLLTGIAGGVLAYVGAAHLLPEARSEHQSRASSIILIVSLFVTTALILTALNR